MLLQRLLAASSAHLAAELPVLACSCASLSVQDMPVLVDWRGPGAAAVQPI